MSSDQSLKLSGAEIAVRFFPPICELCDQRIWNPEFWKDSDGLCGPCCTGEANTLFHELWVTVAIPEGLRGEALDAWFEKVWCKWYYNVYGKQLS